MSAGSNNVVVTVTDNVAITIAPKIRDIGVAARQANTYLLALQQQLNGVATAGSSLTKQLNSINPVLNNTTQGTSRLTGAFAQLLARVVGAEAGFGMLGGALGRVGVAAGIAGPLIVGALAVGAVAGAILIYQKYEEQQTKILEAQSNVAKTTNDLNDELLKQNETLIGLTQGPLARYRQELADLPLKSIKIDLEDLRREWQAQDSFWNNGLDKIDAFIQNVGRVGSNAISSFLNPQFKPTVTQGAFTTNDVKQFVASEELKRQTAGRTVEILKADAEETARDAAVFAEQSKEDQFKALQAEIVDYRNMIRTKTELAQSQTGAEQRITNDSIRQLSEVYQRDLQAYARYQNEKKSLTAATNGELLSEQRRQAAEELAAFNEQVSNLKSQSGVVSPTQIRDLRQRQLEEFTTEHPNSFDPSSPFSSARQTLLKDVANATEAIDRQTRSLEQLTEKYKESADLAGAYSVQLRIVAQQAKATQEAQRIGQDNPNLQRTIEQNNAIIAGKERDAEITKQQTAIYNEFNEPILRYNAAIEASNRLLKDGAITTNEAAIAQNEATRARQDSLNPLNEYTIQLEHEVSLLGIYGTALQVATEVDRVRQDLQKQGRDLTSQETTQLTLYLTQLERQRRLQAEINSLYETNAGNVERLLIQQEALNKAKQQGIIGDTQYKVGLANVNIALANQALLEDKTAKLRDQFIAGLGKYISGYQGLAKGISDAYGDAFKTIADGAANSIGRALAYGEDLGDAFKNVAREVTSGLISAFIKLGIQWVITEAIGKTIASSSLAVAIAQAEAVSAAWAPAAAFASLATFGANAAPAGAAISGTVALSEALAAFGGAFAQGGLVTGGSGNKDDVLALLTGGEFVVKASATRQHRELLEQINSGTNSIRANNTWTSNPNAPSKLSVQVVHDGSTNIRVQQIDDGHVRIIAKQEAERAVYSHAPKAISSDISNPNSQTSKSMSQHFVVSRRR